MQKKRIILREEQLEGILRESLDEVSPERKGAALVNANKSERDLRRRKRNGEKTMMKNGRMVDIDNEIKRKQRQADMFGRGLGHDMTVNQNPETRRKYDDAVAGLRQKLRPESIKSYLESHGVPSYRFQEEYNKRQQSLTDQLRRLTDRSRFNVFAKDGGYRVETNPEEPRNSQLLAYSYPDSDGLSYDDPTYANQAHRAQGVTDALMGYDDEINGGKPLGDRLKYLTDRQQDAEDYRKYSSDLDNWNERRRANDAEHAEYNSLPAYRRMFRKKPAEFNDPKPKFNDRTLHTTRDEDGNEHGGPYFFDDNPEHYNEPIMKQRSRNDRYRKAARNPRF